MKDNIVNFISENKVVVLFVALCIGAIYVSGNPLTFVAGELFTRFGRNGFMVLALLIPVLAGMGLNFGITIGAIAAQIAVFWIIYWGFEGIQGFLLSVLMSTPIALLNEGLRDDCRYGFGVFRRWSLSTFLSICNRRNHTCI